jgi:hypothetical protein
LAQPNIWWANYSYFLAAVSAAIAAAVESAQIVAESVVTAVESVLTSVEALPPQAANVAIATIANTFFIFVCFFIN